jgi:hypothetical protein
MANRKSTVPRDSLRAADWPRRPGCAGPTSRSPRLRAAALEPYAGRGVLNAGAVTFHGVVDDYVYRARRALGDGDADRWRHAAQSAYRRIGARWWERALGGLRCPRPSPRRSPRLTNTMRPSLAS